MQAAHVQRQLRLLTFAALVLLVPFGCAHPYVRTLEAFQAAQKRGDYDKAAAYLAPDARSWWEKTAGAGSPLTAKKGKAGGPTGITTSSVR